MPIARSSELWAHVLTWLAVIPGLTAKSVDGASAFSYPLILLPFISSAFVPTATMPGPVRAFAENQPVTAIVDAIRNLLAGQPVAATSGSRWPGAEGCSPRPTGSRCSPTAAGSPDCGGFGQAGTMLTIGRLASYAGVTVRRCATTTRSDCPRSPNAMPPARTYDAAAVVRLIRIRTLAEAGVPLARVTHACRYRLAIRRQVRRTSRLPYPDSHGAAVVAMSGTGASLR